VWAQWYTAVIPDTWEAEIGGSQIETSQGKVTGRLYLKNELKGRGLRVVVYLPSK
jgi:hypothetical protein